MTEHRGRYIPVTPAGSALVHLESETEAGAWENLLNEGSQMPYKTQAEFRRRGYTVENWGGGPSAD